MLWIDNVHICTVKLILNLTMQHFAFNKRYYGQFRKGVTFYLTQDSGTLRQLKITAKKQNFLTKKKKKKKKNKNKNKNKKNKGCSKRCFICLFTCLLDGS